jgi:hypothetical protein
MKLKGGRICKSFSESDSRSNHWRRLEERRQREAEPVLITPAPGSLASVLGRKRKDQK